MYRHILLPTDGSELARKAVTHGLSLAKSLGAKVSVVTVETPFHVFDVYLIVGHRKAWRFAIEGEGVWLRQPNATPHPPFLHHVRQAFGSRLANKTGSCDVILDYKGRLRSSSTSTPSVTSLKAQLEGGAADRACTQRRPRGECLTAR